MQGPWVRCWNRFIVGWRGSREIRSGDVFLLAQVDYKITTQVCFLSPSQYIRQPNFVVLMLHGRRVSSKDFSFLRIMISEDEIMISELHFPIKIWGLQTTSRLCWWVQCGRIWCEDAFLRTSHNWRQVFSQFWNTYASLVDFLGDSHYFKLCAQSETILIFFYISLFQICIKCDCTLSKQHNLIGKTACKGTIWWLCKDSALTDTSQYLQNNP
jgi:hypothetical protein